jgi:hypothetical protein
VSFKSFPIFEDRKASVAVVIGPRVYSVKVLPDTEWLVVGGNKRWASYLTRETSRISEVLQLRNFLSWMFLSENLIGSNLAYGQANNWFSELEIVEVADRRCFDELDQDCSSSSASTT